nr:MAG TPA: hypothetical protein [Caudoviricetes sp.]
MNFYCTTEHCSCMGIKQFSAGKAIRCTAESRENKSEPSCDSCKWYAETEGVCVNDQSECVADFVWDERGCKEWEKRDETSADL